MSQIDVKCAGIIEAAPEVVFAILADFHEAHPAILPGEFKKVTVLQGGTGAGTVYDLEMEVMGVRSRYRMRVSEPEPGRVLLEQDEGGAVTTTMTVAPAGAGRSRVMIHSRFRTSSGLKGVLERLFQPAIVRRIYEKELRRLNTYVQTRPQGSPA